MLLRVVNDKIGDFHYGIGASMSYLNTEVVNVNQAYQECG